jgi:hypothetical protein
MTIRAELADGRILEFPDGTDPGVIQATVKRMIAEAPAQQSDAPKPQEGIGAALTGGFKRFLSTGETALESLVNPELAAQRGVERAQQIGQQYAPGASLDKVKQAYAERGFFPAVGEAISQIPSALAEQAPQIAATLGAAKAGAMAGATLGPVGAVVGGLGGAAAPSLLQLYGANIERQAQEKAPEISRAAALAAAAPGAALEVASTFIPLGRNLVGKLLGPSAEKALARGSNEAIERAAQETLTASIAKGAGVGVLAEVPTEVTQQMLERLQAGLPLTTEDALKEYGEAAYGAGLVGGPFGAGARALGRPAARSEFERIQQEEADRLAVSEEELAQRFPDVLPGGFKINREELGTETVPQGFSIMAEGRDEPLSVVDTQEDADAKLEALTKIREQEREKIFKDEEKINADVKKSRDRLEYLEATEQTGTEEYQSLKAELPNLMDESAQKIKDLYERSESLSKPLTVMPFGETQRVNEQFNVLGPDQTPVGTFKTIGEAEAVVTKAVGEDVFKQTQQNREVAKELYKTFVPQMRKFGLGDVGLNIVDRIENGAGGAYLNKLIKVSLEEANPVQTMRHEALHAMKDLGFFTPQQWKALEDRANKQWIKELKEARYDENQSRYDAYVDLFTKEGEQKGFAGKELEQYVNEAVVEEAIADAFGAYDKGAKPPPGMIASLYKKIKDFFASLGQAFRGAGFQSADDIFQNIERGRLKPATVGPVATAPTAITPAVDAQAAQPIEAQEEKPGATKPKEKEDEATRPAKSVKRPSPRGKLSIAAPAEREGAGRGERGLGQIAPLEGAPSVPGFSGPIPEIVTAAEKYAKDNGIPYKRQASYVRVDPDRATRIAQAYADMPHAPQDPKVREAYDDLIEQTTAQYKALVDAGYKFWFMDMSRPDNQEYASSPWNALRDLRNNKEMGVFPTNDGFGSSDAFNPDESPLLRTTEFKWPVGSPNGPLQPVLANDLFRAVHDAFGHGIEGAGFRADGEENAWQAHVRLFKGPAIGAITSETRGQNSWLNYGPNGDKNRTAKIEDTVFADQKTGLMPEWTWEEGRADDQGIVLGTKQPGAISVKAAHYGNARVSELDPAKYGTGLRGAERRRLEQAFDDRIKRRVYFYIRKEDGSTPPPEAGVGNHVYTQQFDNILGPGAEMSRLFREGNGDSNNFESNVIDAGYDGYAAPSMGMMVILNHKVPVNYVGPRSEVGVQKLSLKRVAFPTVKEAKEAVKNAVMPDNEAFKLYNAGNQWVDKDGKPRVFYHATAREFFEFTPAGQSQAIFLAETPEEAETFGSIAEDRLRREIYRALSKDEKLNFFQGVVSGAVEKKAITEKQGQDFIRQANRKVPDYGDFGDIEQATYDALLDLSPTRMSIMPLYARAMTPFDFENKDHVTQVMNWVANNTQYPQDFPEKWLNGMKGRVSQGLWQAIEDKRVQQAIRALGFDAFTVRENRSSPKNYAVYKPQQVKSVTGNDGGFSLETKDVRYSLPNLSKDTMDRMKDVTPQRYEPGWKERVIGGLKPDYTELRQRFLNRYETLANYDERNQAKIRAAGGPELLADQRAEFAALQSDLSAGVAASAMGIGDRQGGIPVYRNGLTTIDTSVKGLVEALAPLAKYGDPEVYQRYQFWAGWKRGRRLLREGKEQLYTAADAKRAQEIENNHPEFVQVQKDLIAFNNGIVNYAVQTGVLSRERAQLYTQYADYIPFYRQLDLDKTIGPNPFSGISGVRGPKELKGGESPLGDFLENMVRNTQSMINAGMKNAAAQRATKVALEIKEVERLPGKADGLGFDVYTQLENGQLVYYRSSDSLFIEALKSLNMPDLPFMGLLSAPANVLRNLVTKDPGFMMANLLRDSLSSYVTSGQKITPIVGTMVNFGKALSGKNKNLQALFNAGIIGGYEFSQNIEQSGQSLSDDLNKKAGKDPILLRPFKSLWEGLEKGTTASDAATRMAVYERVMKETGNEAEAISRALEVMNFNRKGNSVLIRIATAALPFFNARLQGLDLFYRASTGQMNTQDAKEIQKRFWIRGMTMSALSVMYYLSVADDEEYEKQEEETKDNNWIFPSLGIRIPIPFEVGTLFKTMPERITAYLMGNDTGKELGQSTLRALANTFALNPIPQTFKPIIEAATNYNFFTMRPIVGQGMQEVEARFQVGPGTSKAAEYIGGILNLSPLKVDQVIKGYTGTIGGYVTDVVDSITSQFSDVPKASLRFEQLPVVKRFVSDPEARGSVTQFYELQRSVDTVVRTMSLLEKTARPEEFAKYLQDNIGLLAVKDYVRDIEKSMKELREMRRTINSSPMEPDEKRDILIDLGRMENNLTANIGQVKKAISELK